MLKDLVLHTWVLLSKSVMYNVDLIEISFRTAKAQASLTALQKFWKSESISLETKLSVLKRSSMLYARETWVLTKEYTRKIGPTGI